MPINTATIDEALNAFGEHAQTLATLTLKDADRFVSEIEQTINNNDIEGTKVASHSLKSIMRQIGANEVADVSFTIETAASEGNKETCRTSYLELLPLYEETKAYLTE